LPSRSAASSWTASDKKRCYREIMPELKYQELRDSIKSGELMPVYLLYGNDARSIEEAIKELEGAVTGGAPDEFNTDYFHGRENPPDTVLQAAGTLPMMADRRLVVVKHVEEWKGQDREALKEYFADPNPKTVMVLAAFGLAVRGSGASKEDRDLVAAAAKAGAAVNFPRPTAGRLPAVVREMAKNAGKKIDRDAVDLLIELAGDDLLGIEQEIAKAVLYKDEGDTLTREDVLEAVADVKEANVFEFTDAIGSRDAEGALRAFRRMRDQGQEPLRIFGMLLRHFRILWKVRDLMEEGEPPGAISRKVKVNEWVIKKSYLPQAEKFDKADMGRITRAFAELDAKIKSARANPDVLFEAAVIKLCLGRFSS